MSKKTAHFVISLQSDTDGGVEVREDVAGTLPELSSLLTFYIVHFCRTMAKKKQTIAGDAYDEEPEGSDIDE